MSLLLLDNKICLTYSFINNYLVVLSGSRCCPERVHDNHFNQYAIHKI